MYLLLYIPGIFRGHQKRLPKKGADKKETCCHGKLKVHCKKISGEVRRR
jgi:hypothetical protein